MSELQPFINIPPFINRDEEMRFLQSWIAESPKNILFLYGPKSSGKTTLIYRFIEQNLPRTEYDTKHFNLRELLLLVKYDSFLRAFFERKDSEQVKEIRQYDLKVFKLSVETLKGLEDRNLNPFIVMKRELEKISRKGRRPVIIIDELQALDEFYFNGGRQLLNELFNFLVAMTNESHLCHVIIASSDGYFIDRIYSDSKLKITSELKEIDYLRHNDVRDWLAHLDTYSRIDQFVLSEEQRQKIWDFFGGSCWEISNFLGNLLNVCQNGRVADQDFDAELEKKRIMHRSLFVEYATIIPHKKALLREMARVVAEKTTFTVDDLGALVDQGVWEANALIEELNSLVRWNYLSYAPPRAEYALQGRSMEHGLAAYLAMISAPR